MSGYVREVRAGVEACRDLLLSGPALIAGGFNSSEQFDTACCPNTHSALTALLADEFGLTSCYYRHWVVAQDVEAYPTYYHRPNHNQPFHIDYCFASASWQVNEVFVGSFEDWRMRSDHCPLTVDLAPAPRPVASAE